MQRLVELKLTAITAATRSGLPRDTLRNIFRQTKSLPRADTLVRIAHALETTVSYLLGESALSSEQPTTSENSPELRTAEVRPIYVWATTGAQVGNEPLDAQDVVFLHVPGFDFTRLRALEIGDDSMDLYYPEGAYVVFSIADITGVREGDHIVVYAEAEGARTYEVRVLQYDGDDAVAAPASLSSEHDPWYFSAANDSVKIAVVGVVVASVHFRMRPFGASRYPSIENGEAWWLDSEDDGS